MKRYAALMLAVGALSLVACKKKDSSAPAPAPTPATTPAPATTGGTAASPPPAAPTPVAASGTCVEGAYKDPNGVYCVKVPEGYKPPKATRTADGESTDQFETDDGFNFTIEYWKPTERKVSFDDMKKQYAAESGGYKSVESGDFEGGNGFYARMHKDADNSTFTQSVVKSGDRVITCEAETKDSAPLKPVDACKTLHGL